MLGSVGATNLDFAALRALGCDVALTTRESLIRGVNRYYVPFAKTAFLFWARIRS